MSDVSVPAGEQIANLSTISIREIQNHDDAAVEKLFQAAKKPGFFRVDLRTSEFQSLLDDMEPLVRLVSKYFAQDQEVKNLDVRAGADRGYAAAKDHESFEIVHDEIVHPSLAFPRHLSVERERLTGFMNKCRQVAVDILDTLARALETENGNKHDGGIAFDKSLSSSSSLKFISAPTHIRRADAPDTTHTDGGLITLLWCPQLSSRLLDPSTGEWKWIEPMDGCVLVNVADTLQQQSNGILHSCVHQVTQPTDGLQSRYFVSYYLRPNAEEAIK